jgi:hypothetical protein
MANLQRTRVAREALDCSRWQSSGIGLMVLMVLPNKKAAAPYLEAAAFWLAH